MFQQYNVSDAMLQHAEWFKWLQQLNGMTYFLIKIS